VAGWCGPYAYARSSSSHDVLSHISSVFELMFCFVCQESDIKALSLLSNTNLLTSNSQSASISVELFIGTHYFLPSAAFFSAFNINVK
jgi:hypothetical protein